MFIGFFRERRKKRARDVKQKHRTVPSVCTLTVDRTHNLGMCSDRELNLQPSGVWDNVPIN